MTSIQGKLIKPKLGLLELAKQLGSVSRARKAMGYSRDGFYRFKDLYGQGGEEAPMDLSRRKPILKNRVPEHVERAVIDLAIKNPAPGRRKTSPKGHTSASGRACPSCPIRMSSSDAASALGVDEEATFDTDYALSGALGHRFANGFRVEGEVGYRRNDVDGLTATGPGGSITIDVDDDVTNLNFMANAYRDFQMKSVLSPYLGIGLGVSRIELGDSKMIINGATAPIPSDSDTVFAYAAMAGVSVSVADHGRRETPHRERHPPSRLFFVRSNRKQILARPAWMKRSSTFQKARDALCKMSIICRIHSGWQDTGVHPNERQSLLAIRLSASSAARPSKRAVRTEREIARGFVA